jgi:hypothetical protein
MNPREAGDGEFPISSEICVESIQISTEICIEAIDQSGAVRYF